MAQEKKPGLYLFNKFVRGLIDNNAEIRYKNKTYKPGQKNLTIKSLVGEICQIENNKINEITRDLTLKKKNSRKHSVRDDQETIINQLDFYIDNKDFQPNPKLNFTPTDFFIAGEGITLAIYPNAPQAINKNICQFIKTNDLTTIAHIISPGSYKHGPFYPLTKKIKKVIFSGDDSFRSRVKNNLQTLGDQYRSIFLKNLKNVKDYASLTTEEQEETNAPNQFVIPGYALNLKFPFTECFKEEINDPSTQTPSISFNDRQTWFDVYRYYRLKKLMPELLDKNVHDWPKWVIEHVILTEIEYYTIYEYFLELAYTEVKNHVKYSLHMSSDGAKIDMQEDFDDIHGLGKKLSHFKFPGKIEDLIAIRRGTILDGPFSRFPEFLVARNTQSTFEIKFDILEALIGFFHKRICSGVDFSFPKKHTQINEYGELANKLIEQTSENE